jgi:NAD(P)H-hydrate repair Nnr-like enzyme with NAD(P)H-hydrate dehydratase domain
MLERIHGIPARLEKLRAMLKAREGKAEFKENVPAIRDEIARLEAVTLAKAERREIAADPERASLKISEGFAPLASGGQSGDSANPGNVTS